MKGVNKISIHHSAVSRSVQPYQFIAINNYHKKEFGMKSSLGFWGGYQYLIEPNGKIMQYRKDDEEGAHTVKHNQNCIGICLAGNFDIEFPTIPQLTSLKNLLVNKMNEWGVKIENVREHRDLQKNRTCPGRFIPKNFGQSLVAPIKIDPFEAKKAEGINKYKPVGILGRVDKVGCKKG